MPESFLSWVHFGDLHIRERSDENFIDLMSLIADANQHLAGEVNFAYFPGDNADDGSEHQYKLVRKALDQLHLPAHVITGDHDRKSGSLDLFQQYLQPDLYRACDLAGFRLLFLNAMDGSDPKEFDLSSQQLNWFKNELTGARTAKLRTLVFTHLYPSELCKHADAVSRLIREYGVETVDMGHTHYNELANDGYTIYAATRSIGQIEEGPPGFSITAIDGDVVAWKFKERGPWPFVMITSPADEKLITCPASVQHVVRGCIPIRAKIWGDSALRSVLCSIDGQPAQSMKLSLDRWEYVWDSRQVEDGSHSILVTVDGSRTHNPQDEIRVFVSQSGRYSPPPRRSIDYENSIGAYPGKGILGTELGPNEKGTKGPWPSWRGR